MQVFDCDGSCLAKQVCHFIQAFEHLSCSSHSNIGPDVDQLRLTVAPMLFIVHTNRKFMRDSVLLRAPSVRAVTVVRHADSLSLEVRVIKLESRLACWPHVPRLPV